MLTVALAKLVLSASAMVIPGSTTYRSETVLSPSTKLVLPEVVVSVGATMMDLSN